MQQSLREVFALAITYLRCIIKFPNVSYLTQFQIFEKKPPTILSVQSHLVEGIRTASFTVHLILISIVQSSVFSFSASQHVLSDSNKSIFCFVHK